MYLILVYLTQQFVKLSAKKEKRKEKKESVEQCY